MLHICVIYIHVMGDRVFTEHRKMRSLIAPCPFHTRDARLPPSTSHGFTSFILYFSARVELKGERLKSDRSRFAAFGCRHLCVSGTVRTVCLPRGPACLHPTHSQVLHDKGPLQAEGPCVTRAWPCGRQKPGSEGAAGGQAAPPCGGCRYLFSSSV